MNASTFYDNLAKENNGKVNCIINTPNGYRVMTIDGRNEINEMKGKNYKMHATLGSAFKSSQLRSHASFPTFNIIAHGTDFADAEVLKVKG